MCLRIPTEKTSRDLEPALGYKPFSDTPWTHPGHTPDTLDTLDTPDTDQCRLTTPRRRGHGRHNNGATSRSVNSAADPSSEGPPSLRFSIAVPITNRPPFGPRVTPASFDSLLGEANTCNKIRDLSFHCAVGELLWRFWCRTGSR